MGQRHQIFIKIENPVKYERACTYDKEGMKKLRKLFGNGKYTILALHHQWLYGRSPIAMLSNILNITNKETLSSQNPFNTETYIQDVDNFIQNMLMMLQVMTCPLAPRGIGIERMLFLNDIDGDWVLKDFTLGDNNDGVTIIDTITNKYCFVNIYSQDKDKDCTSASRLPSLEPSSAMDYMNAYYGVTKRTLGEYYTEGKDSKEIKEMIKDNKEGNLKLAELIDGQGVELMTSKELKKMFPKVFKKVLT